MKSELVRNFAAALAAAALLAACPSSPERAMDFGPEGEITEPPPDELSRQILRDFEGHAFTLGQNDREAEVRLPSWEPGRRVILPFWLGVNPLMPGFRRPTVGRIYVISEAVLVRPLDPGEYLIRAGSMMFKSDTIFQATRTRYLGTGKMLPTVVRFVGTRTITVPRDAPQTGEITIKVPVLREVSLPMYVEESPAGYAQYEVMNPA
jgi:hypothetical protein